LNVDRTGSRPQRDVAADATAKVRDDPRGADAAAISTGTTMSDDARSTRFFPLVDFVVCLGSAVTTQQLPSQSVSFSERFLMLMRKNTAGGGARTALLESSLMMGG
jgi:hypothetical protein